MGWRSNYASLKYVIGFLLSMICRFLCFIGNTFHFVGTPLLLTFPKICAHTSFSDKFASAAGHITFRNNLVFYQKSFDHKFQWDEGICISEALDVKLRKLIVGCRAHSLQFHVACYAEVMRKFHVLQFMRHVLLTNLPLYFQSLSLSALILMTYCFV